MLTVVQAKLPFDLLYTVHEVCIRTVQMHSRITRLLILLQYGGS